MPQGLQIWDSSGVLILDTTDNTGFVLGVLDFASASQSSSLTNANFSLGTPFYFAQGDLANSQAIPDVSFSGATMTWTANAYAPYNGFIYYGVY